MSTRDWNRTDDAADAGWRWLSSGAEGLAAMVEAIGLARSSVKLQVYIFSASPAAERIRTALVEAAGRGVRVRVLIDALGSYSLPSGYFDELRLQGGECRVFNPLHPRRIVYRNHRKALVCDGSRAIVGGFNVGAEYDGDGRKSGWLDLGLEIAGPLVAGIERGFDNLYARAKLRPRHFAWLRRSRDSDQFQSGSGEVLLSAPGRRPNLIKRRWLRDLGRADRVCIASPYFLPTWGLRRRLMKRARLGARVQLLLPARSDVPLARAAGRSLYGRLLHAGVDIREYQPQILHAKLVIADDTVYVGSANFNTRSLHIDYELMVRIDDPVLAERATLWFDDAIVHARRITLVDWTRNRNLFERLHQRIAYFLMARFDPWIARWLWKRVAP